MQRKREAQVAQLRTYRSRAMTSVLLWLVGGGLALAQCPTREDLGRGIIFEYQERDNRGLVESFALYHRDAGDGRMAVADHPQLTGDPWERLDFSGVLLAEAQRRSGAQRIEVTLDPRLAEALPPQPDEEISGTGTWQGGRARSEVSYLLESGPLEEITIGGCTYAAFPLSVTETRPAADGSDDARRRAGHYIPELSFFHIPPRRSVAGYTRVRSPRFVERFSWPFRGL